MIIQYIASIIEIKICVYIHFFNILIRLNKNDINDITPTERFE